MRDMWMYECDGFESQTLTDLSNRIANYYTTGGHFAGSKLLTVVFKNGGVAKMSKLAKADFDKVVIKKIEDEREAIKECAEYERQLRNPSTVS